MLHLKKKRKMYESFSSKFTLDKPNKSNQVKLKYLKIYAKISKHLFENLLVTL